MNHELEDIIAFVKSLIHQIWGFEVEIAGHFDQLGANLTITHEDERVIASIVGREGQNADALRKLMNVWGRTNNARVNLFIPSQKEIYQKT